LFLWGLGNSILNFFAISVLIWILLLRAGIPKRYHRYAITVWAVVVALATLTFTLGTVKSDFTETAGKVVRKWEEYRGGSPGVPVQVKLVEVVSVVLFDYARRRSVSVGIFALFASG
jgi:hypothetical protein